MTPLLWLAVILGGASTQVTESPDPYGECPVLKAPALPNPDFEGWVSVEGPKCFITSSSLPLQDDSNFRDARRRCEELGGTLATIEDEAENQLIYDEAVSKSEGLVWIGLYQKEPTDAWPWLWVTGQDATFFKWEAGEPNNNDGFGSSEDCAIMKSYDGGEWNDINCDSTRGYVCQTYKARITEEVPERILGEVQGDLLGVVESPDFDACLQACNATDNCEWFTQYNPSKVDPGNLCSLFQNRVDVNLRRCPTCVSGRVEVYEQECDLPGMCEGELIHLETNQPSEEGCQTRCMLIQGCRYYTYDRKEDFCYAFADCPTQSTEFCPAEECISGTPNCEIIPSYENALSSSNHVIE